MGRPDLRDGSPFDPRAQTADKQRRQFGYNNDFLGFSRSTVRTAAFSPSTMNTPPKS